MAETSEMRLYDGYNRRLYINYEERLRFVKAAGKADSYVKTFCLTLLYTGCRISEAIEISSNSVQADAHVISIHSLKKRNKHVVREVPIPEELALLLRDVHKVSKYSKENSPLWLHNNRPVNRSTAYRWVKGVMAVARIEGAQATPKGLRHGYGIHAIRAGVQLHMLQKWMGHADMSTTAIYANALGREEQDVARRMWE